MGIPNKHARSKKYGATLILIVVTAMSMAVFGGAALAVHETGESELDGNMLQDGTPVPPPAPDWETVLSANGDGLAPWTGNPAYVTTGVIAESPDTDLTYFKGGGSKDIHDISEWRYGSTPSAPDKNEITNAYAYAAVPDPTKPTEVVLYFGVDRYSNEGNSAVGFWFFQDKVGLTDIKSKGGFEFSGVHQEGDVFVVSDFTDGGTVETVTVYQWKGGQLVLATVPGNPGTDYATSNAGDSVCGIVNKVAAPTPWPYIPKPNVGVPQEYPPLAFFEGGVNLSALSSSLGCFSSFLAETRSSQETTAQLKDFALGEFEICDANIQIEPDAKNEVGNEHMFTVTVNKVVGGTSSLADGVEVTIDFTWTNGADDQAPNSVVCTTDESGECTVTVNSNSAGQISAHASANVEVLPGNFVAVSTDGEGDNSDDAVKTYVDAKISIAPDATNEVGDSHDFTVTVMKDLGDGNTWVAAAGETVSVAYVLGGGADVQVPNPDSCTTDSLGTCTVTVNSDNAGSITANASVSLDLGLTDQSTVDRSTDGVAPNSDDAVKNYVDAYITIGDDGVNEIGDEHTFTVTVREDTGSGYAPAAGETVTFTTSGSAGSITGGTCTTRSTDTNGQCTVIVDSSVVGSIDVTASSNVSVGEITVAVSTDGSTRPNGQANSDSVVKTWVDARISIDPDGTNEINDDHTFTGHVEINDGSGWADAPSGTQIDFTIVGGPGSLSAASCTTTDTSGMCSVDLTSSVAGVTTVDVSTNVTVSTVTMFRETDGLAGNSDDAVKTWVDARISIDPTATNGITEPHTFTVTVAVNNGSGWGAPADGTIVTVTLTDAGGASSYYISTGNTCSTTGTQSGTCSVTFTSDTAGTTTGHAAVDVTVGGVPLHRETDGNASNSGDAVKTWVAGSLIWHKIDGDTGLALGGATFEVCRTHDRFDIDIDDECQTVLDNAAPDEDPADGEFLMTGLRLGTWTIQETAPPPTYTGDLTIVETLVLTIEFPDGEVVEPWINWPRFEGCSPGWWKSAGVGAYDQASDPLAIAVNEAVLAEWHGGGAPLGWTFDGTTTSLFRDAFNLTEAQMVARGLDPSLTILGAVELGGGNFDALARQGTAALLNSLSVNYLYTASSVLQLVHDALITGNLGTLVDDFNEASNEDHGSCPTG